MITYDQIYEWTTGKWQQLHINKEKNTHEVPDNKFQWRGVMRLDNSMTTYRVFVSGLYCQGLGDGYGLDLRVNME